MKKKSIFWGLFLLSVFSVTLLFPTRASAKMSDNSEVQQEQRSDLSKLTYKVKKSGNGETFKGATMYKGVLVLVLKNSVSQDLISSKIVQKTTLVNIQAGLQKAKKSQLAKNGILVTGAYIESDMGTWYPTITLWYQNPSYIDFDPTTGAMEKYMDTLEDADNYQLFGQWLDNKEGKGIFGGVNLVENENAPEWFNDVFVGNVHFKPVKALSDKDYKKILKSPMKYDHLAMSVNGKITKRSGNIIWVKGLKHPDHKYTLNTINISKKIKKGKKIKITGTFYFAGSHNRITLKDVELKNK